MISNDRTRDEETLRLSKLFMQIVNHEHRQKLLQLAERYAAESKKTNDMIPPNCDS